MFVYIHRKRQVLLAYLLSATVMSAKSRISWEAFDLISNTTILGVFYGIAFTLYCLCVRSLYLQLQDPDLRRQTRFTICYISLLFFCSTTYLALCARMGQLAYVNHASDFPGGPLEYEHNRPSLESTANITTTSILGLIVEILTIAMQVSY